MRVLFCAMRWDYKQPDRGDSFEYTNFWDSLRRYDGVEARLFAFDELESKLGREGMNQALLKQVEEFRPELVFFFMYEDEFLPETVDRVTAKTTTVNWFADDQWRFGTYSRHWAPHLTWVATTDEMAAQSYKRLGFTNVIKTQWGCNNHIYRPLDLVRDIDVSFVGQPHGDRPNTIAAIRAAGFDAKVWGFGWDSGRLSQEEMIEVISRSRINLNLSNASRERGFRHLAGMFVARKGTLVAPRIGEIRQNLKQYRAKARDQIKGRNFEIPGCNSFMLTSYVDGLDEYFVPGKEMVMFSDVDELISKIRHYLSFPDEREATASAAYERTLAEHTYHRRFKDMFLQMGLI
jgi:spore maturation protein CgeB